jgi:hypothetical protein
MSQQNFEFTTLHTREKSDRETGGGKKNFGRLNIIIILKIKYNFIIFIVQI